MKKLERELGLVAVISICVSSMLGSGIFVLPAIAVSYTGPSLWLAYLLSAIAVIPAATSKAELATAMPASGGTYVYLERTFGPLAGTIAGFGLWVSLLLKAAFALIGMGAYLAVVANYPIKPIALALLVAIVVVNILGVGKVSRALIFVVTLSITSLLFLAAYSSLYGEPVGDQTFMANGFGSLLGAIGLVFVSFAGVTKVAAIAEEVKDPRRNIPRGILISLAIVTVMYCFVAYGLTRYLSLDEVAGTLRPISVWAEKMGGHNFGLFFAGVAVLTMGSMANAGILAASRFPFAMSRDNLVPPVFGRLNERFMTPDVSILVSGLLVASSIIFMDVGKVAKLASAFVIALYMMLCATVLIIRETRVKWYKPSYKAPMYPLMQLIGIVSGFALLAQMGLIVFASFALIGSLGTALYFVYGRHRTQHRGVVGIRIKRKDLTETGPDMGALDDPDLPNEANVVVALFGNERSPETLVDFAGALSGEGQIEVAHLTEVPGQTDLRSVETDPPQVRSLARRIKAIGDYSSLNIHYDPIVSHDIYHSVNEISRRVHCKWLIKEFGGKTHGLMTFYNQMGWLEEHLDCHVATYRDAGIRHLKRIMVVIKHSRHDQLVVETAEHLALVNQGELVFVRYMPSDTDQEHLDSERKYLEVLNKNTDADASIEVITGESEVKTILNHSFEYDLLVIGAPHRSRLGRIFGTEMDKIIERANCSVVTLQAHLHNTMNGDFDPD